MTLRRDASEQSSVAMRPLPVPGATSRRRLVVFSPKLGRRVVLGSYALRRVWVALEANPQVSEFCERPVHVEGHAGRLIDFWVQYRSVAPEFWMLAESDEELPERVRGLRVRRIDATTAAAWETPVRNWERILALLTCWRLHRDVLLEQRIMVMLGVWMSLGSVIEGVPEHDAQHVEASLYALLAEGRLKSPGLAQRVLDETTMFRRA